MINIYHYEASPLYSSWLPLAHTVKDNFLTLHNNKPRLMEVQVSNILRLLTHNLAMVIPRQHFISKVSTQSDLSLEPYKQDCAHVGEPTRSPLQFKII